MLRFCSVFCLLFSTFSAQAATIRYAARRDVATGANALRGLAVGDFNRESPRGTSTVTIIWMWLQVSAVQEPTDTKTPLYYPAAFLAYGNPTSQLLQLGNLRPYRPVVSRATA